MAPKGTTCLSVHSWLANWLGLGFCRQSQCSLRRILRNQSCSTRLGKATHLYLLDSTSFLERISCIPRNTARVHSSQPLMAAEGSIWEMTPELLQTHSPWQGDLAVPDSLPAHLRPVFFTDAPWCLRAERVCAEPTLRDLSQAPGTSRAVEGHRSG
ncbi:uncharacterized protein LOC116660797 isoform X4 [Camelus ferus]|uniref:Uncharacterized protein LOC116660797 isoform X4 n=1 Tax=Camelus ferus TaxID=419612 RepID=A0A8B8SC30_CAMFR|nr:uncharacterized protein LOC116660797 isoform X4 [Camelus ferus]